MHKFRIDTTLPDNLPLMLRQRVMEYGNLHLQAAKNEKGEYVYYTYSEFYQTMLGLAAAFKEIGSQPSRL